MSDKRVTIAVNGVSEGAKLLIVPSNATLSEILDQAAAKLSEGASSPYTFTRVFVESGAEVMAANEIMAGDKLFLSGGENFIFASSSSSSAADAAASDAAKYHFLSTIAASAVAQAAALYEKSSNLVKEKGPEIVRVNLEKVETKASDLSAKYQIKDKVVGVSQPWIEWADTHVDAAYESVLKRKTSITQFLQSPLAQRVNETLVIPFRVRLQFSYSTLTDDFRTKSEEAFARIHQSVQAGKEKASDLRQNADAFISDMKVRLGSTWNDRLKEPALSYYSAVTSEYSELLKKADATKIQLQQLFLSTKEKLGDAWVRSVAAAYERYEVTYKQAFEAYTSKVKEPAAAFYVRGFEAYAALQQTSAKGVVTFEEFVAGLRLKMATLWTDKLIEPAKALYETFSAPAGEKPVEAAASS